MLPEVESTIARLYCREYKSLEQIGKLFGYAHSTIKKALIRRGIERRRVGPYSHKCADCGKPTFGKKRCEFHQRCAIAADSRQYKRRIRGTTKPLLDNL